MSELTPQQQRLREQFEGLIAAAAPILDLVLGVGDRISRIVEPEDHEYYPVRSGTESTMLRGSAGFPDEAQGRDDAPAGDRNADA